MTPEIHGDYRSDPESVVSPEVISPPQRRSGFLALMRHRDYAVLWTSQGISLLGDRFHWVAISLWVYARTGSALSVSYAVIALMLGPAAVGLFAGVLVDRWNRKWTMILADIVRGILVGMIPWLMAQDIRLVYVDLFLVSCATAFFRPAMLATIPHTVGREQLMPANSFFAAADTATEILGPIFAGLLVQATGYSWAMYVDGASYFLSASILWFLAVGGIVRVADRRPRVRVLADIKEGFAYIRGDRIQYGLIALIVLGWWVSGLNSLQTPLAKGVIGLTDGQFGWFNGVWGLGYLTASLVLGWYGTRFANGRLIAFGFIGWAVATGVTGLSVNAGMLFSSIFWVGAANIILYVSLSTTIMEVTPEHMLGRVLTTRQVALAVIRVLAMLLFGALADLIGIRQAVVLMGVVSVAGVVAGLIRFPEIPAIGTVIRPGDASVRKPAFSSIRFGGLLLNACDPGYAGVPQRNLNAAVLVIVVVAWGSLLLLETRGALGILAVVGAAVAAKAIQQWWAVRRGSKNVRQPQTPAGRREFDQGRRRPLTTGPTAE